MCATVNSLPCSASIDTNPSALLAHNDFYAKSVNKNYSELMLCCIVALDSFTKENGATTYRSKQSARSNTTSDHQIELSPGDAIFFWGTTDHYAGRNTTTVSRWGVTFRFTPWYIKQMYAYDRLEEETLSTLRKSKLYNNELMKKLGYYSMTPHPLGDRINTRTD